MEMLPGWVVEMVKYVGFPALIFAIWYLAQKSSFRQFEKVLDEAKAERNRFYDSLDRERENDNNAIKEISKVLTVQTAQLAQMNSNIEAQGKSIDEIKHDLRASRRVS